MKSLGDFGIQYYDMLNKREDYLEKKHKRLFKKHANALINSDNVLKDIDKRSKNKLVDLIEHLYSKILNQ